MVNLYRMYDRWDYMYEYETVFVRGEERQRPLMPYMRFSIFVSHRVWIYIY
jgi:hypothetical protein